MVVVGLNASHQHDQNGMTLNDMKETQRVANKLEYVIMFRSTGPWALRWLERGYPSKNFHVKGKSSDWGPQAGFVPFDGFFSKVGYDNEKAMKGTAANIDGIKSRFAAKAPLILTKDELDMQCQTQSGGRKAINRYEKIEKSDDYLLFAAMSGDKTNREYSFRALKLLDGRYEIRCFPPQMIIGHQNLQKMVGYVLEVMTSNEVGAENKPMTGDYDLMLVSPSWRAYGNLSSRVICKKGIHLNGCNPLPDFVVPPGLGMDNVLDPSLHTGGTSKTHYAAVQDKLKNMAYFERQKKLLGSRQGPVMPYQGLPKSVPAAVTDVFIEGEKADYTGVYTPGSMKGNEHNDMGNITPRILETINELNKAMGAVGNNEPFRRVHHNAEAYRNAKFGALTRNDMLTKKDGDLYGDGFPLTVFQPQALCNTDMPTSRYGTVCTLENYDEFAEYVKALKEAGYYVPRNWSWEFTESPKASLGVEINVLGKGIKQLGEDINAFRQKIGGVK